MGGGSGSHAHSITVSQIECCIPSWNAHARSAFVSRTHLRVSVGFALSPCSPSPGAYTLFTGNNYIYYFYPSAVTNTTSMLFQVQASNDAHVLLSSIASDSDPAQLYEIVLGGWADTGSAIRKVKQGYNYAWVSTIGLVSASEFRWFWVSWAGGKIAVGQGQIVGQSVFMSYVDPTATPVNNIAFATGWGATGQWVFSGAADVCLSLFRYGLFIHWCARPTTVCHALGSLSAPGRILCS